MRPLKFSLFVTFCLAATAAAGYSFSLFWQARKDLVSEMRRLAPEAAPAAPAPASAR